MKKADLQNEKRERVDAGGVINIGNKLAEIEGRSEVTKIIDDRGSIGNDEENTGAVAIDLDTTIIVSLQATGHGVKGDEGLGESVLHDLRVEEIGGTGGSVEVDTGGVESGDNKVNVGVPKISDRRLGGRPDHGGISDVNFHTWFWLDQTKNERICFEFDLRNGVRREEG